MICKMNPQNLRKQDGKDNVWEDLIIAILSVNQYTLENTYSKFESLKEVELFNPNNLIQWDTDEIERRLRQGGCDRGNFMTNLFAQRLAALGNMIKNHGIDICETILISKDAKAITELLMPVKGIGPKVLKNLFLLLEIRNSTSLP